jgi:hypothetical protein
MKRKAKKKAEKKAVGAKHLKNSGKSKQLKDSNASPLLLISCVHPCLSSAYFKGLPYYPDE